MVAEVFQHEYQMIWDVFIGTDTIFGHTKICNDKVLQLNSVALLICGFNQLIWSGTLAL